jgi:uncharacterized protein
VSLPQEKFSKEIASQLKFYVYRLIDPRNGETFYVGKGVGNRLFSHVQGEADTVSDELTDKLVRIRKIRNDGFEVGHVIHRHGMTEEQAFEVEGALIDAYPETTNQVSGKHSGERGLMHARQIIEKYEAPTAEFKHPVLLITINRSITERDDIYASVRHAWKVDPKKAEKATFVLAVQQGLIVGAFIAERWILATATNFPGTIDRPGRWGFIGVEAPSQILKLYLRHRVPDELRKRGASNPVRYAG